MNRKKSTVHHNLDHERVRTGVSNILYYEREARRFRNAGTILEERFREHPFGLGPIIPQWEENIDIQWCSRDTDTMTCFIAERIHSMLLAKVTACSMRIIRVPQGDRQNHYYFELGTVLDTVLVGYCTDYSGAGNTAREAITSMFETFSFLMCQPIHDVPHHPTYEREAWKYIEQQRHYEKRRRS